MHETTTITGIGAFVRYAGLTALYDGSIAAMRQTETFQKSLPVVRRVLEMPDGSMPMEQIKAAVAAGTTVDPSWASPLASPDGRAITAPFVAATMQRSLIGRMIGTRPAVFDARVIVQTERPLAHWVAEAAPKPATASAFGQYDPLRPRKAVAIIVTSAELLRAMRPQDMAELGRTMVGAVSLAMDQALMDRGGATAARPGSIVHADAVADTIPSTGSTIAAITADTKDAVASAIDDGSDAAELVWIMHQRDALYIGALRGTQGEVAFPTVNALGGTLHGIPILTTNAVVPAGSPTERIIALANPRRIVIADEGIVRIESARHASLQMSDTPSAGAQQLVNLWSSNLRGALIERFINWVAWPDATIVISGVDYD